MVSKAIKSSVAIVEQEKVKESIYWADAIILGVRGIHLKGLQPEMLDEGGVDLALGSEQNIINFDKNYVCQYILDRVLNPLGLISKEGKVKVNYLKDTLIPMIVAYAESTSSRALEAKKRETAALMSQLNGLSIEENLAKLM